VHRFVSLLEVLAQTWKRWPTKTPDRSHDQALF
jgi:hypothetical protein